MTETFFFDSYAIVELIEGNPGYTEYSRSNIITTKLNIFEVYHVILRETGKSEADNFMKLYYQYVIDFDEAEIKFAAELKLRHRKNNISMADCIGYAVARKHNIKFLTGDKEFERMENVEFVK